jgi:predicted amidohydrolase
MRGAPAQAFTVGLVQMSPAVDPRANLDRPVKLVRDAAAASAEVVCLPELF